MIHQRKRSGRGIVAAAAAMLVAGVCGLLMLGLSLTPAGDWIDAGSITVVVALVCAYCLLVIMAFGK